VYIGLLLLLKEFGVLYTRKIESSRVKLFPIIFPEVETSIIIEYICISSRAICLIDDSPVAHLILSVIVSGV